VHLAETKIHAREGQCLFGTMKQARRLARQLCDSNANQNGERTQKTLVLFSGRAFSQSGLPPLDVDTMNLTSVVVWSCLLGMG